MKPASSQYIPAFDGFRALAAVLVVLFHLLETFSQGPSTQIINHGYLAVDFFYMLSGYVLCLAYDRRWSQMGFGAFVKRRLQRLHPMVVIGSVFGLLLLVFQPCPMFPLLGSAPGWKIAFVFVLGCLMIPAPTSLDIRGWDEMYCLNSPQWTLLYEYLANICYALFLRKAKPWVLGVLAVVAAVFLGDLALNMDLAGVYGDRGAQAYTVIGGWTSTGKDVYIALVRLSYPFLAGMLLCRSGIRIRCSCGPVLGGVLLFCILSMPRLFPGVPMVNGIYEWVCIVFLLPLVLLLGSSAEVDDRLGRACRWAGEFSFPLYLTHFPFVYLQVSLYQKYPDRACLVTVGCLLLILLASYLSFRLLKRIREMR